MSSKKLLSALLVFALMISMLTVPVYSAGSSTKKPGGEEAAELLSRIGIIDAGEDFNPGALVSRADYMVMVLSMLKIDESMISGDNGQLFFDVLPDDKYAGYINSAYNLGLIKGHTGGRFLPNNTISPVEAIVIAMRALGCETIANEAGGYPSGYILWAQRLGILDGLSITDDNTVTYRDAAVLLLNALNADLLETNDGKTFNFNRENSYMKQNYNLVKTTGIIDGNSYAGIYGGAALKDGRVSIDGETYYVPDEYNDRYPGINVVVYYTEDKNEKYIVYMYEKANNILTLDVSDVSQYLPNRLSYTDAGGERVLADISSKAVTLENGIRAIVPESGFTMPKYGSITLIDNTNDGVYDVILVYNYSIYIASFVSGDTIYTLNKKTANINIKDYRSCEIKDKNGNNLAITDLGKNDVLNVYASSDRSRISIIVCTDRLTITVRELAAVNDGYIYQEVTDSQNIVYRTIRDFEDLLSNNTLKINNRYEFALDTNGYIAAVVSAGQSDEYKYGYLVRWDKVEPMIENTAGIKILTSDGIFTDITAERYVTNEATGKRMNSDELLAACTEKQVIRYSLTPEGKLKTIGFASGNKNAGGFRISGTAPSGRNTLTRYYSSAALIGGVIAVDKTTRIFMVPTADKSEDYDKYFVTDSTGVVNERYYPNAKGYVYDDDDVYADVLVIESGETSVRRDSARMLITSVSEGYDELSESVKTKVYGFVNGKERSMFLSDGLTLTYTTSSEEEIPIEAGDIIRYEANMTGYLSLIKLVFDSSEKTLYGTADGNDDNVAYGSDVVHTYGKISKKTGNFLRVIRNGQEEESPYLYPVTASTYIYTYDKSKSADKRVELLIFDDIITLEDDPGNKNMAVMVSTLATVPIIVIYK
jgi:hypothetical protein